MTDQTARQPDDLAAQNGNGAADPAPQQSEQPQADPLAAAQREAADYKDKVLRTLAEMENLRRRTHVWNRRFRARRAGGR